MKIHRNLYHYLYTRYGHATRTEKRFFKAAFFFILVILPTVIIAPTWMSQRSKEALLYLYTPYENLSPGQTFPLELRLATGSQAVNAVGTVLYFDPLVFDVMTMDTEQSFCSFYTENSFDTMKGTVRIACGAPTPGFRGESTIIKLMMRVKNGGHTEITSKPAESMVLANDGRETNLLVKSPPSQSRPSVVVMTYS